MLFDYQGLSEGGMGYIRLMHFDLENEQILFRTYSPSLDDYDAKDETDIGDVAGINGEEEFTISFADLGIEPETKTLETTGLTVDLYGSGVIGTVENVESGTTAKYTWTGAPEGTFGWYAEITDANGGLTRTDVNYVTIEKTGYEPVITLPDSSDNAVQEGAEFDPMAGVTAVDYQGNDITDRVTVTGSVDTSVPGTYELTYDVTDEEGNAATAVRIIRVKEETAVERKHPAVKRTLAKRKRPEEKRTLAETKHPAVKRHLAVTKIPAAMTAEKRPPAEMEEERIPENHRRPAIRPAENFRFTPQASWPVLPEWRLC